MVHHLIKIAYLFRIIPPFEHSAKQPFLFLRQQGEIAPMPKRRKVCLHKERHRVPARLQRMLVKVQQFHNLILKPNEGLFQAVLVSGRAPVGITICQYRKAHHGHIIPLAQVIKVDEHSLGELGVGTDLDFGVKHNQCRRASLQGDLRHKVRTAHPPTRLGKQLRHLHIQE